MGEYNLNPNLNPQKDHILYSDDEHMVVYLGTASGTSASSYGDVDVNSYLIINRGKGVLLDPGGYKIFPKVLSNISKYIDPRNIEYIHVSPRSRRGR